MRPLFVVFALVVGGACAAGTEANTADINGHWSFTEAVTDVAHDLACADTGTYELQQSGTAFAGAYIQRGTCKTPQGLVDNADSGAVNRGRVVGHTIRFGVPNCEYDGDVTGTPTTRITGRAVCVLQDATRTLNFSGGWEAVR